MEMKIPRACLHSREVADRPCRLGDAKEACHTLNKAQTRRTASLRSRLQAGRTSGESSQNSTCLDGSQTPRSRTAPSVTANLTFLCANITAGTSADASIQLFGLQLIQGRKCGRVVCNSCSPHRIIIPHQYIVRPPGTELPLSASILIDGLGAGYFGVNGPSGGERVRLCNPCVPDPNIAPPQSPSTPLRPSPRNQRDRSSLGNAYGAAPQTNRYGAVFSTGPSNDPYRAQPYQSSRTRSITMVSRLSLVHCAMLTHCRLMEHKNLGLARRVVEAVHSTSPL